MNLALVHVVQLPDVNITEEHPLANSVLVSRVSGDNGVLAVVGESIPSVVHHTAIVVILAEGRDNIILILDKVAIVS